MRASVVFLSGLATVQAFCPAPAMSGVLSLRAQSESVSRRNVLAGFLGGASVAAVNIIAPAEADAVNPLPNSPQFLSLSTPYPRVLHTDASCALRIHLLDLDLSRPRRR